MERKADLPFEKMPFGKLPFGKADKSLNIFMSYGHPEAEICQKIKDALCSRGHKVWFDSSEIKAGDDWRRAITEGLMNSQSVLSLMSRHSVRNPGVCLNELSIAIGVKGGNIKTVLLEPEKTVNPPATLIDRQWLDMSDWKEKESDASWFEGKMRELITSIESPENVRFAGEIEHIRKALPRLRYDTSKQNSLLRNPFYGRSWLVDRITAWRMDPNGARMCILYGDPGIGKSSFMARYAHYDSGGTAAVFCEYSRPGFNDPRTVIQTLAYLLACRFPDYRLLLCDLLDESSGSMNSMNASELFDWLIANPFSSIMIDRNSGAQCILIDGLDECGTVEKNVLTEVLIQYADRLPEWLRILASSRRVTGVIAPASGSFHIDMNGEDPENLRDIEEYFRKALDPLIKAAAVEKQKNEKRNAGENAADSDICRVLAQKSGGIFLYAVLIADAVLRGKLPADSFQEFPEGLGSAFFRWFQWFFPDQGTYEKEGAPVWSMILASPEALPVHEAALAMNWTRKRMKTVLGSFSVLLKFGENESGEETVAPSHKFIEEWLCSRQAGVWQVDPMDGAQILGDAFLEIYEEVPEDLTEYEALYLKRFLERSGKKREVRKMKGNPRLIRRLLDTGIRCFRAEQDEKAQQFLREAEAWGTGVLDFQEDELERNPDQAEALELVGDVYHHLGMILEGLGDNVSIAESIRYYEKYLHASSTLYAWKVRKASFSYPICAAGATQMGPNACGITSKDERYALTYARALGRMGDGYRKFGTSEGLKTAITWYEKREETLLSLLKLHPSKKIRSALTSACRQLIKALTESGGGNDLEKALSYAEKAILQTELLNVPQTADSLCHRGYSYFWKGGVLFRLAKNHPETLVRAEDAFNHAVEDFRKADSLEHSPKNSRALAQGLFRLGEVFIESGTWEKLQAASELYVQCKEIARELWEQSHTPERLRELALSCRALGVCRQRSGDLAYAKTCFQESLNVSLELTKRVDMIQYRRDLAISYGRMGEVLEQTASSKDELKASFSQHEECLRILQGIPSVRQTGAVLFETISCEERMGDFLIRHKEEFTSEWNLSAENYYHSALSLLKASDLPLRAEMISRIQEKLQADTGE